MDIPNNRKWMQRHLRMAFQAASWSKDESSQVGAVIVTQDGKPRSYGFNGMPRGINDDVPERHERPDKYMWFEHAERNAIYLARGDLHDCMIFVTHLPCPDCCRGIIQSGIKYVVVATQNGMNSEFVQKRKQNLEISLPMLQEAGIVYYEIMNDVELQAIDNELFVVPRLEVPDWELNFAPEYTMPRPTGYEKYD